jgi:hypothetical protein
MALQVYSHIVPGGWNIPVGGVAKTECLSLASFNTTGSENHNHQPVGNHRVAGAAGTHIQALELVIVDSRCRLAEDWSGVRHIVAREF